MSLAAADDAVGHSGQAVTLPAARGQHLFTRTKRHLMDWARERGLAGMYSEATAAHPYSQKANIELGAHETGFLLGWIPASVGNDAAAGRRGAAVGGALLHEAERRSRARRLRARAPPRDRRPDDRALRAARARSPSRRPAAELPARSELHVEVDHDHNLALITVTQPGRRPRAGDRRRAPPPLPPPQPRRDLHRPAAGAAGDRPASPTTSSGSASPTPGSSPTTAPTATCCGCSRCTGSESRPTTLPSPRTTGANCWSTSWRTYRGWPRPLPRGRRGGRRPCA